MENNPLLAKSIVWTFVPRDLNFTLERNAHKKGKG
jgi:hypothetical protein